MAKALLPLLLLCGCATHGRIAVPTIHGGTNYYSYLAVGGIIRPGVIVVFAESNTNGQPVLAQGIGSPIAPSVLGVAAHVGSGLALGSTLRPDEENTIVIENEPHAPMIDPPPKPRRPVKSPHDNRAPDHPKFPKK